MHILSLTAADAMRYRELMLEAYTRAADAFTSTAEERALEPESWWIDRIASTAGLSVCFGAETEGRLVGAVSLEYSAKPKTRHAALLIGMYVSRDARGQGAARALLTAALQHASQRRGVITVNLTVTEGNTPAISLYQSAGFQAWGTQPLAIATPSGFRGKVHMCCTLPGRRPA